MSPLNSNKLKNFHFTTSQNNVTITVQKCSVFFSSFFNLCSDVLSILLKMSVLSFFTYALFNNVQVSSLSFFFFPFFFSCPVRFCFCFHFLFTFFFQFFFFIINCSFNVPFFSALYLPLCLYLNTITIGSLPSLFNFSLWYHKLSLIYNITFSIAYEHSTSFLFFHKISRFFFL